MRVIHHFIRVIEMCFVTYGNDRDGLAGQAGPDQLAHRTNAAIRTRPVDQRRGPHSSRWFDSIPLAIIRCFAHHELPLTNCRRADSGWGTKDATAADQKDCASPPIIRDLLDQRISPIAPEM